jgi:hypothetical protein
MMLLISKEKQAIVIKDKKIPKLAVRKVSFVRSIYRLNGKMLYHNKFN